MMRSALTEGERLQEGDRMRQARTTVRMRIFTP